MFSNGGKSLRLSIVAIVTAATSVLSQDMSLDSWLTDHGGSTPYIALEKKSDWPVTPKLYGQLLNALANWSQNGAKTDPSVLKISYTDQAYLLAAAKKITSFDIPVYLNAIQSNSSMCKEL